MVKIAIDNRLGGRRYPQARGRDKICWDASNEVMSTGCIAATVSCVNCDLENLFHFSWLDMCPLLEVMNVKLCCVALSPARL